LGLEKRPRRLCHQAIKLLPEEIFVKNELKVLIYTAIQG
jgi:hypothetical protein